MRNWVFNLKSKSTSELIRLILEDLSWVAFCQVDDELAHRAIAGDDEAYGWYCPEEVV